jgi:hypothetical protein
VNTPGVCWDRRILPSSASSFWRPGPVQFDSVAVHSFSFLGVIDYWFDIHINQTNSQTITTTTIKPFYFQAGYDRLDMVNKKKVRNKSEKE